MRGKLHLTATVNGSRPLDLVFDTGADANLLTRSAMDKGAGLTFDGAGSTTGVGGQLQYAVSRGNRLEVGGLRWDSETFGFAERLSKHDQDGIVGYGIFQDKVVELDYERMVMVVHDVLPAPRRALQQSLDAGHWIPHGYHRDNGTGREKSCGPVYHRRRSGRSDERECRVRDEEPVFLRPCRRSAKTSRAALGRMAFGAASMSCPRSPSRDLF